MRILYHPKKSIGPVLGFYPFVAPSGFNRTAQDVDIYDVFCKYYATNNTARFIYSFTSSIATLALGAYSGISYRWGETISGTDYVYDVASGTAFTAGSTKRYVIVNNTASSFALTYSTFKIGAIWGYFGNCTLTSFSPNNSYLNVQTYLKYLHFNDLESVKSIPDYALYLCTNLTGTLTFPTSSLTGIGKQAFQGCIGLTGTLTLPASITSLGNFGIFRDCTGFTGLDLGTTIQYIYNTNGTNYWGTFSGCTGISKSSFTLPNSLVYIGNGTFYNCTHIGGTLTLPSNITYIGLDAFRGTIISGDLTIPSSVITLGGFSYCTLLTGTLTIPDNVTTITTQAFYNCTGFTGLSIGSSVITIQQEAFYKCTNIAGALILPDSLTTIGIQSFQYCSKITGTLTIPDNVTSIQYGGFGYMTGLTGLSLGTSLQYLYGHGSAEHVGVFYGSTNIAGALTLPSSLIHIGRGCFGFLSKLTGTLTIPDNVTIIQPKAFINCTGFTGLSIGSSVANIQTSAFSGCSGMIGTLTIPASVVTIQETAFTFTKFTNISSSATNFTIEDYVLYDITTGVKALYGAGGYSGPLTIKSNATEILAECFYQNNNRTGSITIPNTVTIIGNYAFKQSSGFTGAVTLSNTLITIGTGAFETCQISGTLVIPSTVTTIGGNAFYNNGLITRVDSYPETAPTVGGAAFAYISAKPLHIPAGSSSYTTAPWTTTTIFSSITKDL
ncbi:MAG: leucine-rich repeat domain-containing protein [Candidatus Omnitrophica bacterium]|jgi:hypothetical protein|nr:leucine-rich repeat domain-containing protein [Candidatus Omnitrophota bacterium]